ncbi:MAG: SulP family inorganic anion transporter [Blastocatellia bacterium]|nr:SulP family inorganic anion transporter [Blastocatellia bacterium]
MNLNMFPPRQWLPNYRLSWLGADVVAGVTLAAYAVPVSLAYAALAGVPPETGIYGYILGGIGYALFGSSKHLAVGPTSAISMLVGTTVAGLSMGDPSRHAQIASVAALTFAVLSVVAWLLRLSALTSFISETILLGFKAGAGISIAMTQLPGFFGVAGGGDHFFQRVGILAGQLSGANLVTTTVGVTALVLLLLGERFLPGRPIALGVVAASIAAAGYLSLATFGVVTVGEIPSGLPSIGLPELRAVDVDGVIPLAFACLLLAYIESVSAAKAFAAKHGYEIDVRQELLGLGAANFAASLGHGYPVAGGLSQSAVNEKAGAKSPIALVVASIALAACLLFLTGLVADLPKAVLAAIVLVAVKGLINLPEIVRLRRISLFEFHVALVALGGVLVLGILKGVLLAAVASLLLLIRRAASPQVAFLGRIPGTNRFSDSARHPDNEPIPGVLAFRVEASLLYFNVDNVLKALLDRINSEPAGLRLVVADLSSTPTVDMAGARMLFKLSEDLVKRNVTFRMVETHAQVRDMLRAVGLEESMGPVNRHTTLADAIAEPG